ncbi:MAG: M23 family metallopeptidase [Pseudomonadota bacterium]
MLEAIYLQIALLLLTLLWFAFSARRGGWDFFLKTLAVTVLLVGLLVGGVWVYPPYWGAGIFAFLLAAVGIWKVRQQPRPTPIWRSLLSNLSSLILLLVGGYLAVLGLTGRSQNPTGPTIDLISPFDSNRSACVLSGGLNGLLNLHNFGSDDPQDQGQVCALDFMGFDDLGFRVRSGQRLLAKPKVLQDYLAFGMAVYAPCHGKVVYVEADQADQTIGKKVRVKSNTIILACSDTHVWMTHLKSGSISVKNGDRVRAGDYLAKIGNSGHTEEPHLHLHAEKMVDANNPWVHGSPVHMKINNRFLARGDCLP